jgi:hypothetical protein
MTGIKPGVRACRVKVNQALSAHRFLEEYVENVSISGAFIRSDLPPKIGTVIQIRHSLSSSEKTIIEGEGVVVRISDNPIGMGVMFTKLTKESMDILARLSAQQEKDE